MPGRNLCGRGRSLRTGVGVGTFDGVRRGGTVFLVVRRFALPPIDVGVRGVRGVRRLGVRGVAISPRRRAQQGARYAESSMQKNWR